MWSRIRGNEKKALNSLTPSRRKWYLSHCWESKVARSTRGGRALRAQTTACVRALRGPQPRTFRIQGRQLPVAKTQCLRGRMQPGQVGRVRSEGFHLGRVGKEGLEANEPPTTELWFRWLWKVDDRAEQWWGRKRTWQTQKAIVSGGKKTPSPARSAWSTKEMMGPLAKLGRL